jgi:phospholipid/cholesterol/gamma-HCH transport system permease protein
MDGLGPGFLATVRMRSNPKRTDKIAEGGILSFERAGDATLVIRLSGVWSLKGGLPSTAEVERQIASSPQRVAFQAQGLSDWDSSLLAFLARVAELCRARGISMDREGLPSGIRRLLALAEAVPTRKGARRESARPPLLERVGIAGIAAAGSVGEMLAFLGEMTLAFGRLLGMKARYRASDLFLMIQECGVQALPIVTLISFLVGVILAFVGAVQLKKFGAQLYVADLVGIALTRDMGAMMTAVLMAGRTGAAFAAQLGTMKVTQEIDAFATLGFPPMELLVLPRVIALVLMMPLLCLYSDFIGVLGGAAVGMGMLNFSWTTYFQETVHAIRLTDVFGGVFKSAVYGALVALSGCLRGLECGNSSSAVGDAATSAVVTGIVAVIVACGVFAVVFYVLGI